MPIPIGIQSKAMGVDLFYAPLSPACLDLLRSPTANRSRNAFEQSLLLLMRSMIPAQLKVILLADRGFGRTELARFCQTHGFSNVIRIQPNVHVRCASFTGKLIDYPVHKGISTAQPNKRRTARESHSRSVLCSSGCQSLQPQRYGPLLPQQRRPGQTGDESECALCAIAADAAMHQAAAFAGPGIPSANCTNCSAVSGLEK
jgi:hypothetical protein